MLAGNLAHNGISTSSRIWLKKSPFGRYIAYEARLYALTKSNSLIPRKLRYSLINSSNVGKLHSKLNALLIRRSLVRVQLGEPNIRVLRQLAPRPFLLSKKPDTPQFRLNPLSKIWGNSTSRLLNEAQHQVRHTCTIVTRVQARQGLMIDRLATCKTLQN